VTVLSRLALQFFNFIQINLKHVTPRQAIAPAPVPENDRAQVRAVECRPGLRCRRVGTAPGRRPSASAKKCAVVGPGGLCGTRPTPTAPDVFDAARVAANPDGWARSDSKNPRRCWCNYCLDALLDEATRPKREKQKKVCGRWVLARCDAERRPVVLRQAIAANRLLPPSLAAPESRWPSRSAGDGQGRRRNGMPDRRAPCFKRHAPKRG